MTDIEINRYAAGNDWERVRINAVRLEDNNWEARADGELGLIAFLKGDGRKAAWMVGAPYCQPKQIEMWALRPDTWNSLVWGLMSSGDGARRGLPSIGH